VPVAVPATGTATAVPNIAEDVLLGEEIREDARLNPSVTVGESPKSPVDGAGRNGG
jgi:hypothetical protein